jgi:dihydroorotate dehydrogenase electron transfer subunit
MMDEGARPDGVLAGPVFAEVISGAEIARDIHSIEFEILEKYRNDFLEPLPGQFVMLYLDDHDKSMLLPRPFSVCDWSDGRLRIVFGAVGGGSRLLAGLAGAGLADPAPGRRLRLGRPAGNGFGLSALEGFGEAVLVGGGLGAAPLLFLAKRLRQAGGIRIRAALGYGSEPFLLDEFRDCADELLVATDDGSAGFHGTVVSLLKEQAFTGGEYIFSCGPKRMLRAMARFAGGQGIPLQASLEERMGCGYGACLGCVCKVGRRRPALTPDAGGAQASGGVVSLRVCTDGPVFDGSEVIWDV